MKIQDLRDDLAEMRYFRKSYLRKMKNEMGGPMLPMPHGNGGTDADSPMLPDGGSPYRDNDDGTMEPIDPIDDVIVPNLQGYQRLFDLIRRITGTMM
jgi:hypothetical protein